MASLAQTTQLTRTALKWAGILFALFLVIRLILFPIGKAIWNTAFPKAPPAPTTAFGKLPKIPFPQGIHGSNLTFQIQTTTGALPPTCVFDTCVANDDPTRPKNIPDRVDVFPAVEQVARLSSYDLAKEKVAAIGFTGEGTAISPVIYRWDHPKAQGRQITFHTITFAFTLTSPFLPDSTPPTREEAVISTKNFLSRMLLLPKDLDENKTRTTFLKLQNGSPVKTTSLADSNLLQVDLYRKALNNLPIVYPKLEQSLISLRVKKDTDPNLQIVQANFAYKPIDETKASTYPVKTAQQAFAELQEGDAYISSDSSAKGTIALQKVYLAYYEGDDAIPYLLPVFVFEGNNFQAFVSAISQDWQE